MLLRETTLIHNRGFKILIYKVTNKITGKCYIGKTSKLLEERKRRHLSDSKRRNSISYFHKSILKYGIENFEWETIVDNINNSIALKNYEVYYIKLYNTKSPNGYNLTNGGDGCSGVNVSDNAGTDYTLSVSGNVNSSIAGSYIISYTATDSAGNTSVLTRVVNVIEEQK